MLFGFKQNKCKQEVYSKEEVDSKYLLQDNFAILNGKLVMTEGAAEMTVGFPKGFNSTNCVVLSFMGHHTSETDVMSYGYLEDSAAYVAGTVAHCIKFNTDNTITIRIKNQIASGSGSGDFPFKLILMKVPEVDISGYQLGDVNMDGAITEDDLTLLSQYLENTATLTDTQIKLADVNKDGQLTSADLMQMRKYLNGEIDSF